MCKQFFCYKLLRMSFYFWFNGLNNRTCYGLRGRMLFAPAVLLFTLYFLLFTSLAQEPLPACRYDDVLTLHQTYDDWSMTLLDTIYMLPETYAPADLVLASQAGLSPDYKVRPIVIEPLRQLLNDAQAAGVRLELQSAYRSYSYQQTTFNFWVEKEGKEAALKSSARPGHSEHQLGTSVDFREVGGKAPWDLEDFAQTPGGAWLAEYAWKYGFIMSYPKDTSDLTCYIYEPWHYRYVGLEVAKAVKESGLTLRQWLWQHQ
jgi:zinc D-Ala-D-Ala carboxypeptidase